ncbi:MAG TPA: dihydrodipicolinate synthase family protein [Kofleriaceae bacterium]|nr:dihydrodipicolinate synthase family protein [Kofleriaceae bacterium]
MPAKLSLPRPDRTLETYETRGAQRTWPRPGRPIAARVAYAAAHVVADPLADVDPTTRTAIDWDATLRFRHLLWSYGLGVAEAMDTAQRGMGLDWPASQELIRRSLAEARSAGGVIACGAGTDHLAPDGGVTLEAIERAYEDQCGFVEAHGGRVILMASRALARAARTPDDYLRVYGKILRQVETPVILHWLGEMFDPQLAGYWGSSDTDEAMDLCVALILEHRGKIDGIKISLLDADKEIAMRRRLPPSVKMYTGDDFSYDRLILGDEHGFSHALLGIFDAIAPAASGALQALDLGDVAAFRSILAPTVPLSRHIFQAPTYSYKTGIVFLAYLNGYQAHFRMVGGKESARSVLHLAELYRLADAAGLILDAELAAERMRRVLVVAGVP